MSAKIIPFPKRGKITECVCGSCYVEHDERMTFSDFRCTWCPPAKQVSPPSR